MQKIIPHLWFDKEAKEAARFHTSVFPNSRITSESVLSGPMGDNEVMAFEIMGYKFQSISAGPYFKVNPSISFMVNFDPSKMENAEEKLNEVWNKLIDGGKALMPLDKYPFSELYGWVEDKYGVSWQLILTSASLVANEVSVTDPNGEDRPEIIPSLLFTKDVYGKAEEASDYYISVFKNSKRGTIAKYGEGMEPDKPEAVMFTDFMLENQWFAAMDSAREHEFTFTEGVSLMVNCDSQEEIDYFWKKLSAVPESEQCGWCKDKYGVSWQILPSILEDVWMKGTPEQARRVVDAFMPMKKLDWDTLQKAYDGTN